jgi:serine/threonine protein kinase
VTQGVTLTEEALAAGVLVGGKYRLVSQCGTGSMGSVWSAEHLGLAQRVAIKFLHRWLESTRGGRERFEREAKIAATLGEGSLHFPRVLDFATLEDGTAYIVMELLHGESLEQRLQRSIVPFVEAAGIVCQLCDALQLAHDNGILHRDLKPANVFLCDTEDGLLVKILDFGVARISTAGAYVTTQQGLLLGSPNYMSPERMIEGAAVDSRADLWAVAVMTYLATTGTMPFGRHENIQDLCVAILQGDIVAPSSIVANLPATFDAWVRRGLAKNIGDRFPTAHAMTEALVAVVPSARPARSVPPSALGSRSMPPAAFAGDSLRPAGVPARARAAPMVAVAIALLLVAGVVGWFVSRPGSVASRATGPTAASQVAATPSLLAPSLPGAEATSGAAALAKAPAASPTPSVADASAPGASVGRTPLLSPGRVSSPNRALPSGSPLVRKAAEQWKKGDEM